jgi:nucleotide-binding universal stress UspA family protein
MNRILCATDLSSGADDVIAAAAAVAAALGAPLEILHVIETSAVSADGAVAWVADARAAAERDLRRRCAALARLGLPGISHLVETGRADEVIFGVCEAAKPLLLVLGTHGRGPLVRMLVGSVAERSLRRAPCPILVLPPSVRQPLAHWNAAQRPLRVAVGVDFSPATATTIGCLQLLRSKFPCDVTLLHLYWPPQESRRLGIACGATRADGRGEIDVVLERELRKSLGEIPGPGPLALHVRPDWGQEEQPLALEAERSGADVLILGTSAGSGASTAIGALRLGRTAVLCVPAVAAAAGTRAHPDKRADPFRSVAVFTDFSAAGEAALSEAVWLLRGSGKLTICHVIGDEALHRDADVRAQVARRLGAAAATVDQTLAKSPSIEVCTLIHEGPSVAEGIAQAIRRIGPDVVVLGSRSSASVGPDHPAHSVADAVVRLSPLPIVIAPPARKPHGGAPHANK